MPHKKITMRRKVLIIQRKRRARRTRARVQGTAERPRFSVFRSNKYTLVQLIDDVSGKTLLSISSRGIGTITNKTDAAKKTGETLALEAKKKGITRVVFDRGAYKYHGRVKAIAEGAREGGLKI